MTTPKKSFILYVDQIDTIRLLDDDSRLELFDAICAYQKEEEFPPTEKTNLVLLPIIQQFKRDDEKWNDIRAKRADAGKKGGIKSGKKRKQKKQKKQMLTLVDKGLDKVEDIPKKTDQNEANEAVTVNVTDTVTVNGNVINPVLSKKEDKESFDEFWLAYPKKISKTEAQKKYFLLLKQSPNLGAVIIAAIDKQKEWRETKELKGEFVPEWKHPTTWLNQGCWEDDLSESSEFKISDAVRGRIKTYFLNTGKQATTEQIKAWQVKADSGEKV